ncbi:hypothetical protein [Pleomorphomonas oryzae]|uniref:hypothetical protein n=1 Tax=Pleomorphomonas oryzae TaxID=261934 RepID=UPI000408463A|nr:hypothetical protein [Pleomorphomonas oryzae]
MRTPDNSPDSPDNYIAYKDEQRQRDEKRKTFQAANRVKDAAGSSSSDAQLSDLAAERTGSKPAPEDMVKANHELFREAADYAWADGIRAGSPITLAIASDPKDTPLPKDQYNHLASVEQATGNLVAASKTIPDGTPWAGGWLNSPPIPNPELADEFADVRPQDSPERKTVPSVWDKPSEMPEAVQDGTMLNGGWADSLPVPRTNARPSGDLTADAAAIRQQSDQQSNGNSAPSGDQSNNNGLRPGEKVIWLDGVASEPSDAASSTRGDPVAGPAFGGAQPASSPASSGQALSSKAGDDDEKLGSGLRPGEKLINVEVVPEPGAGLPNGNTTSSPSSVAVSAQPTPKGPAELSAVGTGGRSEDAPAFGQTLPFSSAMPLGPEFKTQIDLPEAPSTRASIALGIAKIGENPDPQLLKAFKDLIVRQPYISQELALSVIDGVANGSLSEGQALAKLTYIPPSGREILSDEIANAASLTEEQAKALAERIKAQQDLPPELGLQMLEWVRGDNPTYGPEDAKNLLMATTDKELADLTDSIVSSKGKSPEEIEAIRRKIYEQNAIDPLLADDVLKQFLSGEKDEIWARTALERQWLSDNLIELAKALPGSVIAAGGRFIKLMGHIGLDSETPEHKSLVNDILGMRGKSQAEIEAIHQRVLNDENYNYLIGGFNAMLEGADPEQVRAMISPSVVGKIMTDNGEAVDNFGKKVLPAAPGRENIFGRKVGEMAGPLIVALGLEQIVHGAGWAFLTADAVGTADEQGRKLKLDPQTLAKVKRETLVVAALTNAPLGNLLMKIPGLGKLAGGITERLVIQPSVDVALQVGQQVGQNAIVKWNYDKNRDLFDDVGVAAATSALLSGLKITGGSLFEKATVGSKPHYAPLDPQNAIAAAQRATGLKERLEDLAAIVEPKLPQLRETEKIRYVVDKTAFGTEVENVYFKADTIVDSLRKAGISAEDFAKSLRITTNEFEAAVKSGGYVRTTLGTFMADIVGTKLSDVALQHATFKPGETSFAEGRALIDRLRKEQAGRTGADSPEDRSTTSAAP